MKESHRIGALLSMAALMITLFVGCNQKPAESGSSDTTGTSTANITEPAVTDSTVSESGATETTSGTGSASVTGTGTTKAAPSGSTEYFPVRSGIKGEVKVYIPWALSSDYNEYAAEFKRVYPQASVKYLVGEYVNRDVKLSAYIRANNSPDIVPSGINDYPKRMISNMLQPIDSLIANTKDVKLLNVSDMQNLLSWKGKTYIMAGYPNPSVLYYNKTLFKNEGVKTPLEYYNEGKWNWSNFKKAAKEMTIMDDTGSKLHHHGPGTEWEIIFPLASGVDIVNANGSLNTGNATLRKSLQFYYDMVSKDKIAVPNRWGVLNMFAKNKKVAMYYAYNDAGSIVDNGLKDFEVVPFPKADGQNDYRGHALTGGYGVPTGAKNPEGGIAFVETVLNYNARKFKEGKIKTYYTKEQQARIDKIKTVCTRLDGYGLAVSFDDQFGNDMRGGGDLVTKLEEYKPIWQREIDLVLKGK